MKKTYKKFNILALVLSITVLSACGTGTKQSEAQQKETNTSNKVATIITSDMITYDKDDIYSDWEGKDTKYIELKGTTANINGSDATASGGKISISSAGVYAISGKLDNGQIVVDVPNKGIVRLVLNGVEISNSNSSPIYVKNAGKTIISLPEGANNTLIDGKEYIKADSSDEPTATIFSKYNLTLNGTGTLKLQSNYKDGIVCKDDLKITGGNISIVSVDDGLIGRDMVLVKDGNINIDAGGDAVKATNDTDTKKGFIALEGGNFNLKAGADGIQAETSILASGGKYTITTGGGNSKAPVKADNMNQLPMGKKSESTTVKTETEKESKKALKATSDISISGGTFVIDSYDDAINSNNSVNITGGDIAIASGDDGIHADSAINIKGGKVDIKKSYEGIESMVVTISDGEVYVVSSDDGININGGKDGSAVNGRPGQNEFAVSENSKLIINGGFISVDSSGDGLDSNGSISMTNGKVFVSGPTTNGNGALDYNGTFEITGGLLIAAGSSGMAQAPSEQSAQNSILMYYPSTQQAGTKINLKDSKGNVLASYEPKKQYQSVVISSPDIKKGSAYTLYSGDTKVVDYSISNSVTYLSEAGITTQRGNNPGGGGGKAPGVKGDRMPPGQMPPQK